MRVGFPNVFASRRMVSHTRKTNTVKNVLGFGIFDQRHDVIFRGISFLFVGEVIYPEFDKDYLDVHHSTQIVRGCA